METVIVIGSGPSACAAALRLSRSSSSVIVLERGRPMPEAPVHKPGNILNGIMRINRNDQSIVLGGGASINYGVYVTPTKEEMRDMFGGSPPASLKEFHAHVSSKLATDLPTNRHAGRASSLLASALNVRREAPIKDASIAGGELLRTYADSEEEGAWIKVGSIVDEKTGYRNSPLKLVDQARNVTIHTSTYVVKVSPRQETRGKWDGKWRWYAHTEDGRTFEADRIVICAGAIGTAELLLRSKLERGVTSHVGAKLLDHRRVSVMAWYGGCDTISLMDARVNNLFVRKGLHVEVVTQPGFEGVSNLSTRSVECCLSTSDIASCLPSWCTISPTLSTESFDPWCCFGPCAATCNPCRYANSVAFVVGTRADVPGRVRISASGSTRVDPSRLSEKSKEELQSLSDLVAETMRKDPRTCCVLGADSKRSDTEWHHAGTVPYKLATNSYGEVLDENGVAYSGLQVGDLSLLHTLPTLNTQASAALCGWMVSGKTIELSVMERV